MWCMALVLLRGKVEAKALARTKPSPIAKQSDGMNNGRTCSKMQTTALQTALHANDCPAD